MYQCDVFQFMEIQSPFQDPQRINEVMYSPDFDNIFND